MDDSDKVINIERHIENISRIKDKGTRKKKIEELKTTLRRIEGEEKNKLIKLGQTNSDNLTKIEFAIGDVYCFRDKDEIAEHNKRIKAMEVVANNILTLLLTDKEVKNMGRNLIEGMPEWFYTDVSMLLHIDDLMSFSFPYEIQSLLFLLASIEERVEAQLSFMNNQHAQPIEKYIKVGCEYLEMLNAFVYAAFANKSYIRIDNKFANAIAYSFINRLVIEHFSEGQERNFPNIAELSLDKAIEQFCFSNVAEQELNHFIYFLMKYKKFNTNNHNFPRCKEVFMVTFNHFMELKKFHDLSNRLKRPRT